MLKWWISWICVVFLAAFVVQHGFAAEKVNFSGKYRAEHSKSALAEEVDSSLEVAQSEDAVDIKKAAGGMNSTSHCPFNGSEGDYISLRGISGKCKAQLKGKNLVIESVVLTRPQPASAPVRMRTKERWQLSADAKVLVIKSDADFPDFPPEISSAVAGSTSGTTKYVRVGSN
ncbi:MAG TPA: hypothetical protein VFO39_21210 [Candidatus Sulfotelmatobacter sp.]|nr:hypothetical protein [Candidatus Sulfotelmatobacter sp.]